MADLIKKETQNNSFVLETTISNFLKLYSLLSTQYFHIYFLNHVFLLKNNYTINLLKTTT